MRYGTVTFSESTQSLRCLYGGINFTNWWALNGACSMSLWTKVIHSEEKRVHKLFLTKFVKVDTRWMLTCVWKKTYTNESTQITFFNLTVNFARLDHWQQHTPLQLVKMPFWLHLIIGPKRLVKLPIYLPVRPSPSATMAANGTQSSTKVRQPSMWMSSFRSRFVISLAWTESALWSEKSSGMNLSTW